MIAVLLLNKFECLPLCLLQPDQILDVNISSDTHSEQVLLRIATAVPTRQSTLVMLITGPSEFEG